MIFLMQILQYIFVCTGYVSNSLLFPEPLSPEEEQKNIASYLNNKDSEAKNELILHNLRLVAFIVKKYSSVNVEQDDLISIGTIGLIKGLERYDNTKNVKLSTYLAKCIENEILMYLRSFKKVKNDVSLNAVIGEDKDGNELSYLNILEAEETDIDYNLDLREDIKKLYKKIKTVLKDREKYIIELRFGLNGNIPQTQQEIAKKLKISRSYVSRIETKALDKLSKELLK